MFLSLYRFGFYKIPAIVVFTLLLFGCQETYRQKGSPEYISEINTWHQQRIENLKKSNGWLNLIGLYWLNEGENSFGSDSSNDIVFNSSNIAPFMGVLTLNKGVITIKVNTDIEITSNNEPVTEMILNSDQSGEPTLLNHGTLQWFIIKRENKFGVRVRDFEAELIKTFTGIDRYPVNEDWRIEAKFVPYIPPKKISVPSIIGTVSESECYGKLEFEKDGGIYTLEPLGKDYLFLVFADQTNGIDTYGAGRFLSVDPPDSTGITYIDFNKAYNPPCAFSKFATCPLPPKENYLKLEVTAGEKKYGDH